MKDFIEKVGKKTILLIVVFLILIVIILFGGAFIYNKYFFKKSYTEIENIMVDASKSYFKDNKVKLPNELNATTTIPVSTLVKQEKMKSIDEYIKDESIKCSGNVIVTNLGKRYRYTANLDCGEKYKTKYFIDYIKNKVNVVDKGNGLYNVNNELIYRGDTVDNYVVFYTDKNSSKKKYRIVKVTDEYVMLIYTEKLESVVWDDRYNSQTEDDSGINDYNVSRVKDHLQNLYDDKSILNSYTRNAIVTHKVGIGKREALANDKTGSIENSVYMDNQYLTLLPVYDFMNASLDSNCTNTTSRSCQNYNYLARYTSSWWTSTADSANSYKVYKVTGKDGGNSGYVSSTNSINVAKPRFVLYTARDVLYVKGNGSSSNPYIIK